MKAEAMNQVLSSLNVFNVVISFYFNITADKKGNSLFAEVDDQRQHMKQILAQQKQQYLKVYDYYLSKELNNNYSKKLI